MKTSQEITDPQHKQQESRRIKHFLIKVGLVYVLISMALFYLFSTLLRNHAYYDMSRDEIHHISEMVFENMYSVMLSGKGKAEIEAAAKRISETGPGMLISVIRGEIVAQKFGEDEIDKMRRLNDPAISDTFKTGTEEMIHKNNSMRYLYPAIFREACQQCHTNSKSGQVAGVVEIIYPISDLKVSTNYVNLLMMAYFSSSFIVLIIFLGFTYRRNC